MRLGLPGLPSDDRPSRDAERVGKFSLTYSRGKTDRPSHRNWRKGRPLEQSLDFGHDTTLPQAAARFERHPWEKVRDGSHGTAVPGDRLQHRRYNRPVEYEGFQVPGERHTFRLDNGVRVSVTINIDAGRVEIPSVAISAPDVSADTLRDIPIGKIREEIRRLLTKGGPGTASLLDGWAFAAELYRGSGLDIPEPLALAEKQVAAAVENLRSRKGRPRLTDGFLRDVALAWIAAVGVSPRGARRMLAEEFGYSPETLAGWVSKARKAGWLAETEPGRTGADPGPRLIEWNEGETE